MNNQLDGSRNWHRLRVVAGWSLCVLPVLALAEAPQVFRGRPVAAAAGGGAAEPNGTPAPGPGDPNDVQPPGPRPRFNSHALTQQELDDAEQWIEKYAPRRWAYLEPIKSSDPRQFNRALREYFFPRISQIDRLKQDNPKLYDLRMKRITLEDEAFGMLQDYKAAKTDAAKAALKASLKAKLGEMYDNTIDERQQRIDDFTAFLQTQQQKLQDDKNADRRDQHVADTLDRAIQTGSLENPNRENKPHGLHDNNPATRPQPPSPSPSDAPTTQ